MTDILRDKPFAPADTDTWRPEGKSPSEIESDIELTRRRMTEDIDAIGEKFSPEHLKQRARDAVRGAQEAVVDKVEEVTGEVGRKTREVGSGLVSAIRENPLPAMAAGAALFWLLFPRKQKHSLAEGTRRAGSKAQNILEDNPLVAAAGVAVLGAILGATLPRTRKENTLMGSTRDDLVERAGSVASQAKQTFKDKLSAPGSSGGTGTEHYVKPGSDIGNFNAGAGAGSEPEFPAPGDFQG